MVAVMIVAGVLAAGCSGSDSGSDSSSGPDDAGSAEGDAPAGGAGLQVTLRRSTLFETHRALSLSVRNGDADHDVAIGTIQLDSPRFEPVDPDDRDARIRAERTASLPLPFGAAACDGAADGPAELVVEVDGETERVPVTESPSDLLATLQGNECAEAAIDEQLDLALDAGWERTGPTTIEGTFEMAQATDGVTAEIEQMEGNVIFHVAADGDDGDGPWLRVDDDEPSARGTLTIEASRCDPHALLEFKRPFVIFGYVSVGDAEPVRYDIEAQGEARRAMGELMSGCLPEPDA
jgi:hypothetical protein